MLCALLLLCYYTFLTFVLGSAVTHPIALHDVYDNPARSHAAEESVVCGNVAPLHPTGTGEGEVAEAESLLKPFRQHYPRVSFWEWS